MKRTILVLLVALQPLTVKAQSVISDSAIQGIADDLKPAFCQNDLIKATQAVQECYARVDKDKLHKDINQCVMEDILVIGLIKQREKKLIAAKEYSPYSDIDYMKSSNIKARVNKYPNFTHDHNEDTERKAMLTAGKAAYLLKQQGCFNIDKLK